MKPIPSYATLPPTNQQDTIRLMLIGPAGAGKSTAAATFPNPIWVDMDNNIPPELRGKFPTIPMWDKEFLIKQKTDKLAGEAIAKYPFNFFGQILKDIALLDSDQTIVFDHLSALSDIFLNYVDDTFKIAISKNSYERWNLYADFLCDFFNATHQVRCNVVLICHEDEIRDVETNRVTGRRFLLPGKKFTPKLPGYFNNVFRQTKASEYKAPAAINDKYNTVTNYKYLWQVRQSDNGFDLARTTIPGNVTFVPATYNAFKKS